MAGISTKYRVIAGFLILIIMLGIMAFTGFNIIQVSSHNFEQYRKIARLNRITSDFQAEFFLAGQDVITYTFSLDEKTLNEAKEAMSLSKGHLEEAKALAERPETQAVLNELGKRIAAYSALIEELVRHLNASSVSMEEGVIPAFETMIAQLEKARELSALNYNESLEHKISDLIAAFWARHIVVARYEGSLNPDDAASFKKQTSQIVSLFDDLNKVTRTDAERGAAKELLSNEGVLVRAFDKLEMDINGIQEAFNKMAVEKGAVGKAMDSLNAAITKEQDSLGAAGRESNRTSSQRLILLSVIGLAFGVLSASVIIVSLVRMLGKVSVYAREVADGNFTSTLDVREGGEVGSMVESLREIPVVLNKMSDEFDDVSGRISHGYLRERGDYKAFKGAYSDLVRTTNSMLNGLGAMLDIISNPLLIYNQETDILYMNQAATDFMGKDGIGQKGCELLSSKPGSKKPAQTCFMVSDKPYAMETAFYIKGQEEEASVSGVPLVNRDKKQVGGVVTINIITEVKHAQRLMRQVADEANEIADRVAAASEELSAQIDQISKGAEIQRDQAASTATAMEEMNVTVLDVARNAGDASIQADSTRNKAQEGSGVVSTVVSNINKVNTISVALQKDMQSLGEQAEAIGGVMNVISDIADQTNLLALNAAIEAARAGEAGRGFAVVADEVRKLAEKTMNATKEVGSSINAIQNAAAQNIQNVSSAVSSIAETTDQAKLSGHALDEIVSLANQNSMLISSMAAAAEEQSATSEEVNRSVDSINRVANETAESMVQSAEAVHELAEMAQRLKSTLDRLK